MAVYTVLDRENIEAFIKPYGLGPLLDFKGVAEGIENTNYFISTDQSNIPSETNTQPVQHFVLTIFESITAKQLSVYINLTSRLNNNGLPVPSPLVCTDGNVIQIWQGKPALLIPKVNGSHPKTPSIKQCQAIGSTLAHVHLACNDIKEDQESNHNLEWLNKTAACLAPQLSKEDAALVQETKRFTQLTLKHPDLPRSIIHGDLFRDNVLFEQDQLTAIIDFYSAGNGFLLFDLAVVINDWCSSDNGSLKLSSAEAIIDAYRAVRPFTKDETILWNDFLRIAAARFWISRLDKQQTTANSTLRPAGLLEYKDPEQYKNILKHRIAHPMSVTR